MRIITGPVLTGTVLLAPALVVAERPRVAPPPLPSLRTLSAAAAADRAPLAPRCFGYAPATRAFACVGHAPIYNRANIGADDQATNIWIDAIGPALQVGWRIAAIGDRPTTSRREVAARLADLGVRALAVRPVRLAIGAWTLVDGHAWRLHVDGRDGDASFENVGELTVRCGDRDVRVDLREAGVELGDVAVAYPAPDDAGLVALSIVGFDGGEGAAEFTLDTAVIDTRATCGTAHGVLWTTASARRAEQD